MNHEGHEEEKIEVPGGELMGQGDKCLEHVIDAHLCDEYLFRWVVRLFREDEEFQKLIRNYVLLCVARGKVEAIRDDLNGEIRVRPKFWGEDVVKEEFRRLSERLEAEE